MTHAVRRYVGAATRPLPLLIGALCAFLVGAGATSACADSAFATNTIAHFISILLAGGAGLSLGLRRFGRTRRGRVLAVLLAFAAAAIVLVLVAVFYFAVEQGCTD